MGVFNKKQRTSAEILEELAASIRGAVEELGDRRDISLEAVQTNAAIYVPSIVMLVVAAVGARRAQADARVQGGGDATSSGPSNYVRVPKTIGQVFASKAQELAATIAATRKQ